jgi:hypothetical protein
MPVAKRATTVLVIGLALLLAGCGGSDDDPFESELDQSVEAVLDDEGLGEVRNVDCTAAPPTPRFTCKVDIPLGPDVFRETYEVTIEPAVQVTCWSARQTKFERLTGRDADELAVPHELRGCYS